jgi:hypothetical protein
MVNGLLKWFRLNKRRLQEAAYSLLGGLMLLVIVSGPSGPFLSRAIGILVAVVAIGGGVVRALPARATGVGTATVPTRPSRLRETGILVVVFVGYWVASGATYAAWSELVGWPVMSSELGLRLVHLIPAFIGTILAAGVAGVTTRMPMSPAPGLILAGAIALSHFLSYAGVFRHSNGHYIFAWPRRRWFCWLQQRYLIGLWPDSRGNHDHFTR